MGEKLGPKPVRLLELLGPFPHLGFQSDVQVFDLLIRRRVIERDGGLMGKRGHQFEIVLRETVFLRTVHDHAAQDAVLRFERHGQQRLGADQPQQALRQRRCCNERGEQEQGETPIHRLAATARFSGSRHQPSPRDQANIIPRSATMSASTATEMISPMISPIRVMGSDENRDMAPSIRC